MMLYHPAGHTTMSRLTSKNAMHQLSNLYSSEVDVFVCQQCEAGVPPLIFIRYLQHYTNRQPLASLHTSSNHSHS